MSNRLREISALTDPTLGHLGVEELLMELLDRVRNILDADTAAVLLLDEGSNELVARAARGIEEEVRQGVRVPLRRGFAGSIADQKRPVILDRVDHTTVSNPILWQKGIRTMLGVPMLSGGRVLGVLHVGRLSSRPFADEDAGLLQLVAERVTGATQARQAEVERAAADAMQRSLLPSTLPPVAGMEFAARYVPAEPQRGVGGDWYDVFTLPSGEVWVVTGDVLGHSLRAAAGMGRARSAIRAYAMQGREPDDVLSLTDENLRHFDPDQLATAVCAVFRPPFDEVRLSTAGHPAPVMAAPGEPSTLVELTPGLPLGAFPDPTRHSTTVPVPEGGVLFFYTDGLVERRGASLDARLEQLCTVVSADEPYAVCHRVMGLLVGSEISEDDIAILAVRRSIESAAPSA